MGSLSREAFYRPNGRLPPIEAPMPDPTASLRPSLALQLSTVTLLGGMQAALPEPRRAWRFPVLACAAVVVVVLYERTREVDISRFHASHGRASCGAHGCELGCHRFRAHRAASSPAIKRSAMPRLRANGHGCRRRRCGLPPRLAVVSWGRSRRPRRHSLLVARSRTLSVTSHEVSIT